MDYFVHKKQETDQFIYKALFELLEIRPYSEITVTELCARAEIGRKTFYRHFKSVNQIPEIYFHQLCDQYISLVKPLEKYEARKIFLDFFSFWTRYRTELRLIQKSMGFGYITSAILKDAHRVVEYRSGKNTSRFALYSTGGLCSLLEEWVLDEQPEQVDQYVEKLIKEFPSL